MNEHCGNCKYFTKFYVPPLDQYKEQTNGYCCTLFKEQVMWLGSEKKKAGSGICELWTEVNADENES